MHICTSCGQKGDDLPFGDPNACSSCGQKYDQTYTCLGCNNVIDPSVCCCGSFAEDHDYGFGHAFTPMGCDCYRPGTAQRIKDIKDIVIVEEPTTSWDLE